MERTRKCLKCGAVNEQPTFTETEECPKCGAIYSRVESAAAAAAMVMEPRRATAVSGSNSGSKLILYGLAGVLLIGAVIALRPKHNETPKPTHRMTTPTAAAKPAASTTPAATPVDDLAAEPTNEDAVTDETDAADKTAADERQRSACDSLSGLAKTIMDGRQKGVEMSQMMNIATASPMDAANTATRYMVIEAYNRPRFSTPEIIQRSIVDFQNDMYLACITAKAD